MGIKSSSRKVVKVVVSRLTIKRNLLTLPRMEYLRYFLIEVLRDQLRLRLMLRLVHLHLPSLNTQDTQMQRVCVLSVGLTKILLTIKKMVLIGMRRMISITSLAMIIRRCMVCLRQIIYLPTRIELYIYRRLIQVKKQP